MLILHDNVEKINVSKISIMLGCSTRTIHRNMTNELRREKELLNQQL
jgi:transcriptional antiterminator